MMLTLKLYVCGLKSLFCAIMVNLQAALLRWLLLNSGEVMVVASPRLKTIVCAQLQPLHKTSFRLFAAEVKMLEAAGT